LAAPPSLNVFSLFLPQLQGLLRSLLSFVNQSSEKGGKRVQWNKTKTLNLSCGLSISSEPHGYRLEQGQTAFFPTGNAFAPTFRRVKKICFLPELRHADILFAAQRSFCKDRSWKGMG
jgi:hypothetical protein